MSNHHFAVGRAGLPALRPGWLSRAWSAGIATICWFGSVSRWPR